MKKTAVVAFGLSAILALASACGSPTADTDGVSSRAKGAEAKAQKAFGSIQELSGSQRENTLVKKAQGEGRLSLYTSNVDMKDIVDLFKNTYKIDVNVYLGTSESVLQRAQQEWKASYFGDDVIEGNGDALDALAKQGMFSSYAPPERANLPAVARADNWTASRYAVYATVWNTKLIKPADEPKSFADLASPRFKGKLSVEIGDYDWFYTMKKYYLDKGMSASAVDSMFKRIVENAKVTKGHTQQAQYLAAGQFAVCVACYTDAIDRAAADGSPVAWHRSADGVPIQPLVIRTSGTAVMRTAQHPYAAMLFQDFMLNPKVQDLLVKKHRIGTVPRKDDPLKGYQTVPMDQDTVLKDAEKLQKDYDDLLQNAGKSK